MISQAEYLTMLARTSKQPASGVGVEDESPLQSQIAKDCLHRGWICFRGSMAHRTWRTEGEPDFVICADGGRVLLVEAKTRKGKLSAHQLAIQAWARKLGHTIHVVRSFEEWREVSK